ncbi:PspC domain-containing protein [Salsuginibacillus halophilus]|uniref:PspC domain-containing protein n=1 Tax=Salsuginibacillus halophilus TaxID=517424 RepID=UPI000D0D54D2|nr:PspC domain-containing protein [Salsuginibacillus halophilus]
MGLKNGLKKAVNDRSIAGVCGGVAHYYGISSFYVRIIFLVLLVVTPPISLLLYMILANKLTENASV